LIRPAERAFSFRSGWPADLEIGKQFSSIYEVKSIQRDFGSVHIDRLMTTLFPAGNSATGETGGATRMEEDDLTRLDCPPRNPLTLPALDRAKAKEFQLLHQPWSLSGRPFQRLVAVPSRKK